MMSIKYDGAGSGGESQEIDPDLGEMGDETDFSVEAWRVMDEIAFDGLEHLLPGTQVSPAQIEIFHRRTHALNLKRLQEPKEKVWVGRYCT